MDRVNSRRLWGGIARPEDIRSILRDVLAKIRYNEGFISYLGPVKDVGGTEDIFSLSVKTDRPFSEFMLAEIIAMLRPYMVDHMCKLNMDGTLQIFRLRCTFNEVTHTVASKIPDIFELN